MHMHDLWITAEIERLILLREQLLPKMIVVGITHRTDVG